MLKLNLAQKRWLLMNWIRMVNTLQKFCKEMRWKTQKISYFFWWLMSQHIWIVILQYLIWCQVFPFQWYFNIEQNEIRYVLSILFIYRIYSIACSHSVTSSLSWSFSCFLILFSFSKLPLLALNAIKILIGGLRVWAIWAVTVLHIR